MNKLNSKASKAFSLIELSIVILIIGIIVAGITQSSRLVTQSKLKSAQNLTSSSPVAAIKSVSLWLEPTLDASFPSSLDDEAFITQWNDTNPQTPSKLYAIPASASATLSGSSSIAYDSNGINGLPSIKFAGTASTAGVLTVSTTPVSTVSPFFTETPVITVDDPKNANAFTAFIVYNVSSSASFGNTYNILYNGIGSTTGGDGWGYYRANGKRYVVIGGASATPSPDGGLIQTNRPEIAAITFSGNTSNNTYVYINGSIGTSTSSVSMTTTIRKPTQRMLIGAAVTAGTNSWEGLISEIIIFDSVLKNQDLKDVASYLSKKYGISLQ
jgi:prepilin-type N-terminal cleavage/methylation domain-containing protein